MENIVKVDTKKKIFIAGGSILAVVAIIALIFIIINISNKPNKEKAKTLVENYVSAMSEGNGEKMLGLIDSEGYIIFNENKEKTFDENYKKKTDFINDYLNKNSLSDMNAATQKIKTDFENVYGYYTYTINEITSIENSEKSKNLIVVRCKVQLKSNRYSTVNSARFYILKNNGEYKIVGMDM